MIPVEEYLGTVYEPDCDYVDGALVSRNAGEKTHSKLIARLLFCLRDLAPDFFSIQTTRVRISATRYRVPDLCLFAGPEPDEQVFTQPPFVCVEILSPQDRAGAMLDKICDYLSFGVRYVWLVEPHIRRAWIYSVGQMHEVTDGLLRTENPEIIVPLNEIFS